jgi:hypothetical protein
VTRKTRGLATAVLVGLLVVGAAGAAFAGFSDTGNVAPAEIATGINNLQAAGCATGFPDGSFHPNDNVTRAQNAAFTARCDTRATWKLVDPGATPLATGGPGTFSTVGTVGITPGGVPGAGNQFVKVLAVASLFAGGTTNTFQFPGAHIRVVDDAGQTIDCPFVRLGVFIPGPPSQVVNSSGTAICDSVFKEPAGQARTFTVSVVNDGPDGSTVNTGGATVSAESIPHGGTGSNSL